MPKQKSFIPIWLLILDVPAILIALLIKVVFPSFGKVLLILILLFNVLMIILRYRKNKRIKQKCMQEIATAVHETNSAGSVSSGENNLSDMKLF